jgi:hypothetical protein
MLRLQIAFFKEPVFRRRNLIRACRRHRNTRKCAAPLYRLNPKVKVKVKVKAKSNFDNNHHKTNSSNSIWLDRRRVYRLFHRL